MLSEIHSQSMYYLLEYSPIFLDEFVFLNFKYEKPPNVVFVAESPLYQPLFKCVLIF